MSLPSTRVDSRLVVGLGSRDRGDDAVGPEVAARVAARVGTPLTRAGVRVVEHEDPTALIDLWADAGLAVVVDAVRSGQPPGTLVVLEAGADGSQFPAGPWAVTGRGGTHALGLAAVVELARTLGRLPGRLVVVGIEVGGVEHGAPLSPEVAAAVPGAVDAVVTLLEQEPGGAR